MDPCLIVVPNPRTYSIVWKIFLLSQGQRSAVGVYWVRASDAAKHVVVLRRSSSLSYFTERWAMGGMTLRHFLGAYCVSAEKAMAPHSSTLAWKIPWIEEPGRLQSTGLRRVGRDWATSLSLFTFMHWRRKWQPTPVFLPGESQGWRSLVGCRLWGCTESDMTEAT